MADSFALHSLRRLASLPPEEAVAFIFSRPVLLDRDVHDRLDDEIQQLPPAARGELPRFVARLRGMRDGIDAGRAPYPLGLGPIEGIWQRLESGEVRLDYAQALAQEDEVVESLTPEFVQRLSHVMRKKLGSADWLTSLGLHTLLRAACTKLSGRPEWFETDAVVAHAFIQSAQVALVHAPHGTLLRTAVAEGERLIALGRARDASDVVAEGFRSLGVLHLDPYTADRTTTNFNVMHQVWLYRGSQVYGPLASGSDDVAMPEPVAALQTAESYLRQAVPLMEGHDRGLALKALAQSVIFQEALDAEVDHDELARIVDEALQLVDQEQAPDVHDTLRHYRHVLGGKTRANGGEPPPTTGTITAQQIWQTSDPVAALTRIHAIASTMPPHDALDFLAGAQKSVRTVAEESLRINHYTLVLRTIARAAGVTFPEKLDGPTAYDELEATLKSGERPALALIGLAAHAPSWNEEPRALATIPAAEHLSPSLATTFRDAFDLLRATLYLGIGSNGAKADDPVAGIAGYGHAIEAYLRLNMPGHALDRVRRIHELVQRSGANADAAIEVVRALSITVQALSLIDEGVDAVRKLLRDTLTVMTADAMNPVALMFLFQMAKGVRLGAALRAGHDRQAVAALHGDPLLQEIAKRDSAAGAHVLADPSSMAYEILLTAYVGSGEQQSGDDEAERLANLQRAFETRLTAAAAPLHEVNLFAAPKELQQRLDARSVILLYYLGAQPNGNIGTYIVAITRETMRFGVIENEFQDALLEVGVEDRVALTHPLAMHVNAVRTAIVRESPWIVDDEGATLLEHDRLHLLGDLSAFLDEQRKQDKDRLFIVPHGPLHFYPFHLVGKPDTPLSDHWTVAYVPNIQLLLRDSRNARKRAGDVLAVGLGFEGGGHYGLAPLPAATQEARAIAALFDTAPLLDSAATRAAVLGGLGDARYVHLSTHGAHDVNAASFQSVFLAPDEESDGRLFAHDILALDLRHVEAVTLSACETALGRFDIADNLRGLPASLLLAGVPALVGTLWPVQANPAKAFFVTFYQSVKGGAPIIDAFRAAQVHTRGLYPDYRDWGAFYLIAAPAPDEGVGNLQEPIAAT